MGTAIDWLLARLSENSTWRGIILLITAGGVTVSPDLGLKIISAGMALVGLINVIRRANVQKPGVPVSTPAEVTKTT